MANDFQPFANGGAANVVSQATYVSLLAGALANGFQSGTAASNQLNKVWRQSSIMSAVLAQYISDLTGADSIDDGTTATLLANLKIAAQKSADTWLGGGFKKPVRVATTANIANLATGAPNTLDGVTLAANDRVLVKDQTTASQNGLYYVVTLGTGVNGTWGRVLDADVSGELTSGTLVAVSEGVVSGASVWQLTTTGTIIIGTTGLAFARKDSGASSNSGKVAQVVSTYTGTVATGTTTVPNDNTIPQNTEGDQYMSVTITPVNAGSKLVIESQAFLSHSVGTQMVMALFQDAITGALRASNFSGIGSQNPIGLTVSHEMAAGTTSPITFKIRAGCNNAGTTGFNGSSSGGQILGGVLNSFIRVTEILP